jgi:iron complex transport system ATP-binding protein
MEGAPEDLILNGSFNRLFDESVVQFNAADASFVFRKKMKGEVKIEAAGNLGYWTGKAANRAGFKVSDDGAPIMIKVSTVENKVLWLVTEGTGHFEFATLYDLVGWLGKRGNAINKPA